MLERALDLVFFVVVVLPAGLFLRDGGLALCMCV